MALFIDVARGNPAADERRTWLEPFWGDTFVAYIGRGLLAEHALWRGDTDLALAEAEAAISAEGWPTHTPGGHPARGDRAERPGRPGGRRAGGRGRDRASRGDGRRRRAAGHRPRQGARYPARPKSVLGPEGRGWLARCEAEYQRALGVYSPEAWEKVLAEFGPGYVYETARTQWRLAEALAVAGAGRSAAPGLAGRRRDGREAGGRPAAAPRWTTSAAGRACDMAPRRARRRQRARPRRGAPAGLTDREREVLALVARARATARSPPSCSSPRRQPASTSPTSSPS